MKIQKELFALQDKEYMKFLSKLTPNVSEDTYNYWSKNS